MGSAVMKGLRFADSQESRFQASIRSNMCSAVLLGGLSLIFTNIGFRVRNIEICAVLPSYEVD